MLWMVLVGGTISFLMSCSIGANDVANAVGTAIGAKSMGMLSAIIIAAIFEFLGSMLLGANVVDTLNKGLLQLNVFSEGITPPLYALSMLCVLIGSTFWLIVATYLHLPVSTTHCIVGGMIGVVITMKGYGSIIWYPKVLTIVLSWILSPLIGGVVAVVLYLLVKLLVVDTKNSLRNSYIFLPTMIFFIFTTTTFVVVFHGPSYLYFDKLSVYLVIPISVVVGLLVTAVLSAILIPLIRRRIQKDKENSKSIELSEEVSGSFVEGDEPAPEVVDLSNQHENEGDPSDNHNTSADNALLVAKSDTEDGHVPTKPAEMVDAVLTDTDHTHKPYERVFDALLVICAALTSFSHGSNDVANGIGPFAAIYATYLTNSVMTKAEAPWWILLVGAAGIVIGLATFGYKVIKTIGSGISTKELHAHNAFPSQFAGAIFVMLCSKLGLPVSTTHAIVGAVMGVGIAREYKAPHKAVNWHTIAKIIASWVVTIPVAACITSFMFSLLKWLV